jgi:streptogramin lyase
MLKKIVFLWVMVVPFGHLACNRSSDQMPVALTGIVSSEAEGPMGGVLVKVKGVGTNLTVAVTSDHQGLYAFPRNTLQDGRYYVDVRAAGYDIDNQGWIEVSSERTTSLDLKLEETQRLSAQLTNAEWLLSVPGTQEQKEILFRCVPCHTLLPVIQSNYGPRDFLPILNRMRQYAPAAFRLKPVNLPYQVPGTPPTAEELLKSTPEDGRVPDDLYPSGHGISFSGIAGRKEDAYFAQYLSTVNLSSAKEWEYELNTLPRPSGRATEIIITEYDLPRPESQPHDAAVDSEGMVWYTDFALPYLGRLDPQTGEVKEWQVPLPKPGFPEGSLDIKFDEEGNPWIARLFQAAMARFEKDTEEFTTWSVPGEYNSDRIRTGFFDFAPDGSVVFLAGSGVVRIDPKANRTTASTFTVPDGYSGFFYGISLDSQGKLFGAAMVDGAIGEFDAQTNRMIMYPTPTPNSGPRRLHMDDEDKLWIAEFYAHKLAVFDTQTKEFKEWLLPTSWSGPYDVVVDRTGEVWGGGMHTDRIFRFDPATERFTEYLLASSTNIRRIDVDNSTDPVSVWIGSNHHAKIVRVQPRP